jgi:hypothetical protein
MEEVSRVEENRETTLTILTTWVAKTCRTLRVLRGGGSKVGSYLLSSRRVTNQLYCYAPYSS